MIRLQAFILLIALFFSFAAGQTPFFSFLVPSAEAGLFGTIDSVDVLKEVAANHVRKKDDRAIASEKTPTSDATIEEDGESSAHRKVKTPAAPSNPKN